MTEASSCGVIWAQVESVDPKEANWVLSVLFSPVGPSSACLMEADREMRGS